MAERAFPVTTKESQARFGLACLAVTISTV